MIDHESTIHTTSLSTLYLNIHIMKIKISCACSSPPFFYFINFFIIIAWFLMLSGFWLMHAPLPFILRFFILVILFLYPPQELIWTHALSWNVKLWETLLLLNKLGNSSSNQCWNFAHQFLDWLLIGTFFLLGSLNFDSECVFGNSTFF